MKTKGKGVSLSQLWKRNAVVAAIALFVCCLLYTSNISHPWRDVKRDVRKISHKKEA